MSLEYFITFLTNHWILASAFLIVLLALILNELSQRSLGVPSLHPQELVDWMNHHNAKILDIRNSQAFQQGHIVDSFNIPASDLEQKMKSLGQYQDKPLIIVCNVGQSAAKHAQALQQKGFKHIMVLKGGIEAWRAAGLPLQRKA